MKTHQALLGMFCLLATAAVARPIPERVQSAKKVVVNRMTSSFPIPAWVVDKSKCVAALKVVKAGLGWGGQGSTGLVTCRTDENVWSEPSFFPTNSGRAHNNENNNTKTKKGNKHITQVTE